MDEARAVRGQPTVRASRCVRPRADQRLVPLLAHPSDEPLGDLFRRLLGGAAGGPAGAPAPTHRKRRSAICSGAPSGDPPAATKLPPARRELLQLGAADVCSTTATR